MADSIYTHYQRFDRIELSEDAYEQLLKSFSPRIFPGYRWYEFKPPIASPHGIAHPDAALLSNAGEDWWVVEVELARHSVDGHIDLQLMKLREGWYGPAEFEYIVRRHAEAADLTSRLNVRAPGFLVICDDISTALERAAARNDFDLLHILPFRSGTRLYAASVEGRNPTRKVRRPAGVVLTSVPSGPVAVLRIAHDSMSLPRPPAEILVGSRLVKVWKEKDGRGIILALTYEELVALLGTATSYVLTVDDDSIARLESYPRYGER
jgi:hypothetical protein